MRRPRLFTVLFVLLIGGLTFAGTWDECNCELHPGSPSCGGGGGNGDLHSCDGTWPGCISIGPVNRVGRVYKGFTAQRYHGDGTYGLRETITGHVAYSNGTTRMFDTLYSDSTITELCLPETQVDSHTFGRPLVSPQTSYTEGRYATDLWDCVFGQALEWEWHWNWENASPYVAPESGGGFACTKIKAPPWGWGDSYGWCADD